MRSVTLFKEVPRYVDVVSGVRAAKDGMEAIAL